MYSDPPSSSAGDSLSSLECVEYSSDESERMCKLRSSSMDAAASRTLRKSRSSMLPPKPSHPTERSPEHSGRSFVRSTSAPVYSASKAPEEQPSIESLRQELDYLRDEFGSNHPAVSRTWNLLGNAYFRVKDYEKALDSYRESIISGESASLADSYANMGTVYWTLGDMTHAIELLERARNVYEYNLVGEGKDPLMSLEIAAIHYQMGLAYTLDGSFREAMRNLKTCRKIRTRVLGSDHFAVGQVLEASGKTCMMCRKYGEALRYYERTLAIKRKQVKAGENITITYSTLLNMGIAHQRRGDLEAAIFAFEMIVRRHKKLMGSSSKYPVPLEVPRAMMCVADLQLQRKRPSEAERLCKEALSLCANGGAEYDELRRNLTTKLKEFNQ